MFKKTRRRIVATIMSILVFLYVGIIAAIYGASYYETSDENRKILQAHAMAFSLKDIPDNYKPNAEAPDLGPIINGEPKAGPSNGRDFKNTPAYRLSAFYSVIVTHDGTMFVAENENKIYTDEELLDISSKVYKNSGQTGMTGSLMFYKIDKGDYTLITFLDNSITQNSYFSLLKYTMFGGIFAIIILFFISLQLAKMIVRPLEESYTKQKQFISDAGHELKTPVSVVNANAELLSREIGDNQWLANIQYENERMGALITQLLDLARTENTVPQTEILDFSRLVKGEALPFESVVFEKDMSLTCNIEEDLRLNGNPEQLKQIVAILLDNAVKHASENSDILLSLKREHSHVILSIVNDGDEIPNEQQKNIFERFYRTDTARNGEDKHYGLGLAIAKAIVTAHRGKIDVSCYNGKVEFTVQIPIEK